ncbi:hypothetical protein BDW68DRAFT_172024 [Aspergillus falconensis]
MADNSSSKFRPSIEDGQPDGSRAESSQCPQCQQQSQEQPSHNTDNHSNGDPAYGIQRPGLLPPARSARVKVRTWQIECLCASVYRRIEGLDCQRPGVAKTLGFTVSAAGMSAMYETTSRMDHRHVRRSMGCTANASSAWVEQEKEEFTSPDGRRQVREKSKVAANAPVVAGVFGATGDYETEKTYDVSVQPPQCTKYYIAVGILNWRTGVPRERVVIVQDSNVEVDPEPLFAKIRAATWKIWPLYKRLFSLKTIAGFSLYHCDPDLGYHSSVEIDEQTRLTLLEFYQDYQNIEQDFHGRWRKWTHHHLNGDSFDPREGPYTLQLVLRWSIQKIIIYGLLPVLSSLVIGFGYMESKLLDAEDLGSRLAVIQTAWGISSYVVGTAGVIFAILAAITQIADA